MKNEKKATPPFLSIITRSYRRPSELQRCIDSILNQTDPDFEHLIIPDEIGFGIHWANQQVAQCAYKTMGDYVYILDDDDFIVSFFFIEELKKLINGLDLKPDVIICKGTLDGQKFPKIWKEEIQRGKIAAPNLIVRNQVFDKHARMWDAPRAGDFFFAKDIWKTDPYVFWWDFNVFWAESSRGLTEEQKYEEEETLRKMFEEEQKGKFEFYE